MNILKIELQADCFAGVILASIPNFYITPDDANKLLEIVHENMAMMIMIIGITMVQDIIESFT